MKVPLSWIAEYVPIRLSAEKLAERLLLSGTKVERVERIGNEYTFDFEITSNRPDCLSVIGIAREVSAITGSQLKLPRIGAVEHKSHLDSLRIAITTEDAVLASSSALFDQISIRQSPSLVKKRLELSGIRSINNVVDITNYCMLESGIPLHAFDMDRLSGMPTIRLSKEGETLTTLDDTTHTLPAGSIVIEDENGLIDLAGIMGGENSGITHNTKRVLLHVPIYNPLRIRRTSKLLGLRTEGSTRYEKQLDLTATQWVLHRAGDLLADHAGARFASKVLTKNASYYPTTILFDPETVRSLLGISVSEHNCARYLKALGFTVRKENALLRVTIPPFRRDVAIKEDLVEEIARIVGYQSFPKTLPRGSIPQPEELYETDISHPIKQACVSAGFSEHYGSPLTGGELLRSLGLTRPISLVNPMSKDFDSLRTTLLISLLPAVALNLKSFPVVPLFEYGRIYAPSAKIDAQQRLVLGMVSAGESFTAFRARIHHVLTSCHIPETLQLRGSTPFIKDQSATIGGGVLGSVSRDILAKFAIYVPVWYCEIPSASFQSALNKPYKILPIPSTPALKHDMTLRLSKNRPLGVLIETIKAAGGQLVAGISLLDTYEHSDTTVSHTIQITYQSEKHTLSEREVKSVEENIRVALGKQGVLV